ncbi:MAG: Hsp33 family molecular chaperone HslO [Steroidobacteraceae bacterium]
MHDTDCLHRFDFEHLPIRGLLIHMDASWRALLEHRDYPPVIRDTLGEAVVASVLLAATIKFDGQLTLQMKGDGPMHLLLAQCTAGLGVRGLSRYNTEARDLSADIQQLTGSGNLTVTIENEDLKQRYQGIVPIEGARIAQCLETYFEQSEQLPTRLWLHADENGVAGLLLQRLPTPQLLDDSASDDEAQRQAQQRIRLDDDWRRVQLIGDTLKPAELLELADREILRRLFNEDDLRLYDSAPVFFKCRCSRERVSTMLQSLGRDEVQSVLAERGQVEVRCDFCNRAYAFDAVDVAQLFNQAAVPPSDQRRH